MSDFWTKEDEERFQKQMDGIRQLKGVKLPKAAVDALAKIHLFIVERHGWVYIQPKDGIDAIGESLADKMKAVGLIDRRNKRQAVPTKVGLKLVIDLFDDTLQYAGLCTFYRENAWPKV